MGGIGPIIATSAAAWFAEGEKPREAWRIADEAPDDERQAAIAVAVEISGMTPAASPRQPQPPA